MKNKMKTKTKIKIIKMNFRFCFHFVFHFRFCFLFLIFKSFCIFVKSTWLRGAIDGQLSLTWARSGIAFSFANFARGLAVSQMVNSLLIGVEVPQHQKYGTQPNSNMQNSMMLFTFFVFECKYSFWANLVQKSKLSV